MSKSLTDNWRTKKGLKPNQDWFNNNLSQKQKDQARTYSKSKRDSVKFRPSMEIWEEEYPDLLFLEPRESFDKAIVGIVTRINLAVLCYDEDEILNVLIQPDFQMSYEDAIEHLEYNIKGSYNGENTPVFLTRKVDL